MARIDDGHGTTISFASQPSGTGPGITFWEKEITPPGMDGGGENDTTTLRNTLYRTKAPKKLITATEMTCTVSYDSAFYEDILGMILVNQLITITFPDDSTVAFWGWLDKFIPGTIAEGSQPTAEVTIIPSNQNGSGVETDPVYSN
jgi:hypothetical protein